MTMKHKQTKEIKNHLEFIGYAVEDEEAENDKIDIFYAKSETKSTITFRVLNDTMTLLSARWNGLDKKALKSKEFFADINLINKAALYTKWYFDDSGDDLTLVIETLYYGYEKLSFGNLVEVFEVEINQNLAKFNAFAIES